MDGLCEGFGFRLRLHRGCGSHKPDAKEILSARRANWLSRLQAQLDGTENRIAIAGNLDTFRQPKLTVVNETSIARPPQFEFGGPPASFRSSN